MLEFSGNGTALTAGGLTKTLRLSQLGAPELWAVVFVETAGYGYMSDRRPKLIFERHVFSRLTQHRFDHDDPDISQPTAGGYGLSGAHQFDRLNAAAQLDRGAALQSAAWGLGQVMGENFAAAGYANVEDMVAAMVASEDAQLLALVASMCSLGLAASLASHDWAGFARRYNGPDYAAHGYDSLLQHFYEIFSTDAVPDLNVRAAQIGLTYRGFFSATIDGRLGPLTRAAIVRFQQSQHLPQTGEVDPVLLAALR
jgi:hypothetical protein